jgi:hypothetical protein
LFTSLRDTATSPSAAGREGAVEHSVGGIEWSLPKRIRHLTLIWRYSISCAVILYFPLLVLLLRLLWQSPLLSRQWLILAIQR